ncbi:hypothetical protein P152DRAFT_450256 [Eremomyces bilateralis CBS 781.70]|uniref:RNA-dependent RNA polymerase n=1 Tax=Eremomyces bilateralis CBS 781.70 TaxID=1392243 RepID=A0A6G1G0L2_9PEZI|nr:uncharacterized protein P152DRAFT_450256 [Eremomyces bilateralis CBS 781.70]KAF1811558.1 hypothetical protein P152DRAFT_450256 [Eremomyces bilateralis CBS 781.70]
MPQLHSLSTPSGIRTYSPGHQTPGNITPLSKRSLTSKYKHSHYMVNGAIRELNRRWMFGFQERPSLDDPTSHSFDHGASIRAFDGILALFFHNSWDEFIELHEDHWDSLPQHARLDRFLDALDTFRETSRSAGKGKRSESTPQMSPVSSFAEKLQKAGTPIPKRRRTPSFGEGHAATPFLAAPILPPPKKRISNGDSASVPYTTAQSTSGAPPSNMLPPAAQLNWSFGSTVPSANASFGAVFDSNRLSRNTSFTTVPTEPDEDFYKEPLQQEDPGLDFGCPPSSSDPLAGFTDSQLELVFRENNSQDQPQVPEPPRRDGNGRTEMSIVRDFPSKGLHIDFFNELLHLDFFKRFECARVSIDTDRKVKTIWPKVQCADDYESFWSPVKQFPLIARPSLKAWQAGRVQSPNVYYTAELKYNKDRYNIFKLILNPITVEETSNRLHRKFGSHRFLHLSFPLRNHLPDFLRGQETHLFDRFREWTAKPKHFLGCSWEVFYCKEKKVRAKSRKMKSDDDFGLRIVLFATQGPRIKDVSIHELLDWFMPLQSNAQMTYCKGFARLDLALSATYPSVKLKPSEVKFTRDKLADGNPEACEFDDPDFPRSSVAYDFDPDRVMDDGCQVMSVGLAREIWLTLGAEGPLPAAFQGRIAGAKGMWYRSAPSDTTDPHNLQRWIRINDSQLKFKSHSEDLSDDKNYDPDRLTFEVHSYTKKPAPGAIYVDFLPILVNRGVPVGVLQDIVSRPLDEDEKELLDGLENPELCRQWIHKRHAYFEDMHREADSPMLYQGSMPFGQLERAILLLESGFDIHLGLLGDLMQGIAKSYFEDTLKTMRIDCEKCVNLKGIADHSGTLSPGEIHVCFSESIGDGLAQFINQEVLVARNPALRVSDIQKVRAVFKMELAHLQDVVVFPTRGCFPFAARLQGGDYDGDTFWICWEKSIVDPFRNAPAPTKSPNTGDYGVEVDRRTLGDVLKPAPEGGTPDVRDYINESIKFRSKDILGNMLAYSTLYHRKVAYAANSLRHPGVEKLADLHDLLIDSAKNGYLYDQVTFHDYIRSQPDITQVIQAQRAGLSKPAYQESMEQLRSKKRKSTDKPRYNKSHIIDHIYFQVLQPRVQAILRRSFARIAHLASPAPDPTLLARYHHLAHSAAHDPSSVLRTTLITELDALLSALRTLYALHWAAPSRHAMELADRDPSANASLDQLDRRIADCHVRYTDILPHDPTHPTIAEWLIPAAPGIPTSWAILKASALYAVISGEARDPDRRSPRKPGLHRAAGSGGLARQGEKFLWYMAGTELARMKAFREGGRARVLVERMWAGMKPRRIRVELEGGEERGKEVEEVEKEVGVDGFDSDEFHSAAEGW